MRGHSYGTVRTQLLGCLMNLRPQNDVALASLQETGKGFGSSVLCG